MNPAPVYQSGLVFHNNAWKTPNQIVAESNASSEAKPLEEKFPVSAGIMHQKQEATPGAKSASKAVFTKRQVCVHVCVCIRCMYVHVCGVCV